MRSIDADAYEQAIIKMMSSYGSSNYSNDYEKMIADCVSALREMPTISPESIISPKSILPQGLWIENNDEYDNYHYCSNCEKRAPNHKGDGLIVEETPDYCPYCGTHMMGELYVRD